MSRGFALEHPSRRLPRSNFSPHRLERSSPPRFPRSNLSTATSRTYCCLQSSLTPPELPTTSTTAFDCLQSFLPPPELPAVSRASQMLPLALGPPPEPPTSSRASYWLPPETSTSPRASDLLPSLRPPPEHRAMLPPDPSTASKRL